MKSRKRETSHPNIDVKSSGDTKIRIKSMCDDGDKAGVRTHEPDFLGSRKHHMMTTLTKIAVKRKLTETVVEELIHRGR
jgi:hypothetical protein